MTLTPGKVVLSNPLTCTNTAKGDNKLYSDAKGVVPSLDLRFAEGKNLNDYMTGQNLITFSRSSIGTYVDENGIIQTATADQPRFDHDPTTGESLGLLIEESRTNLLQYSERFDNTGGWIPTNSVIIPNQTIAPDGSQTADKITEDSVNTTHYVGSSSSALMSTGVRYTYSVYAKAGERHWLLLSPGAGWGYGWFDLQNGTTGKLVDGGSNAVSNILEVGNGWYRCSITATAQASLGVRFYMSTGDKTVSYLGDGISGLYLWGAQLETGSFPTSYIPTTGTALTRSADVASISGSNFSSWYNQSEGTVFVDRTYNLNFSGQSYYFSDSALVGNRFRLELISHIGTNTDASFFNLPALGNKSALAVKTNDVAVSAGGSSVVSDTTFTLALMDRLFIGKHPTVTSYLNGTISRLTYFPDRLEDSVLQAITQ